MKANTSDLIVLATAKAKPGKEAELERALRDVAGPTRKQPGCVEFRLLRRKDDGATLVGYERWASEAAHDEHLKGAHVQTLMARMKDILAEQPTIVAYSVCDE